MTTLWNALKRCLGAVEVTPVRRDKFEYLTTPWPYDVHVDVVEYKDKAGQARRYISCAADGPNGDGCTMHHSYMGFWDNFQSSKTHRAFAQRLIREIRKRIGVEPTLLLTGAQSNANSSWVIGERKRRPRGADLAKFMASNP